MAPGIQQEDGIDAVQHGQMGISLIDVLNAVHTGPAQAAAQVVCIQRLQQDAALYMAAAVPAQAAGKGCLILGPDGNGRILALCPTPA